VSKTLDGIITSWNPAAERLFEFRADEAIGRSIDIIVPDDRRFEVRNILECVRRGENVSDHETVRVTKEGRRRDIALSVCPLSSPAGTIIGATKVARDITKSKNTQEALRREIEERRCIFEASQDLILIIDRKANFVQVSPSSATILGYLPEEMVGHNGIEFVHPDDLENTRTEMRLVRRGDLMRKFDTRYVHKDGRIVSLNWMGTWSEPLQRYFFIGRDVTEPRLAQEALRESERLARGIVDTALDAIIQVNESGQIIEWNPQAEATFGWLRQEAIGKSIAELYLPKGYRPRYLDMNERLREGDKILQERFEFEAVRKDGQKIKMETSLAGMRRREGNVYNIFLRDLTAKLAAEEQLRQSQKMEAVGQLTGGIAHDFNNILTVITGTTEILSDMANGRTELAELTKEIHEAVDRGAELTRRLLAFSRKQPLQPRKTDVNALIVDAAKLLRQTLGENIEIESVLDDGVEPSLVDPTQLTTALINLALNARDAMPDGGKLMLETTNGHLNESYASAHAEVQSGPYVVVSVSDTGAGIPAGIRDKVFEPFFTTKPVGKGTGLGLSMVYGFVKQSGGHVRIYSEEGQGTTIKVYLPPARDRDDWAASEPAATIERGYETILVVEDDALVRRFATRQLKSLGYTTLLASNAAEALNRIEEGAAFDLLFTDVIMQGAMNGCQLAEEGGETPALA
jgi:PAS domain S-box-containing protein